MSLAKSVVFCAFSPPVPPLLHGAQTNWSRTGRKAYRPRHLHVSQRVVLYVMRELGRGERYDRHVWLGYRGSLSRRRPTLLVHSDFRRDCRQRLQGLICALISLNLALAAPASPPRALRGPNGGPHNYTGDSHTGPTQKRTYSPHQARPFSTRPPTLRLRIDSHLGRSIQHTPPGPLPSVFTPALPPTTRHPSPTQTTCHTPPHTPHTYSHSTSFGHIFLPRGGGLGRIRQHLGVSPAPPAALLAARWRVQAGAVAGLLEVDVDVDVEVEVVGVGGKEGKRGVGVGAGGQRQVGLGAGGKCRGVMKRCAASPMRVND
jgi:hypothetical protein